MPPTRCLVLAAFALLSSESRAQQVDFGSPAEDRLRLSQLVGKAPTDGWLIRSTGTMSRPLTNGNSRSHDTRRCAFRWAPITPRLDLVWNSDIPFETNSGGVWNGRGETIAGTAGVRASCGRWSVRLQPEMWYAANRDFSIIASGAPDRSAFANPFHSGNDWSADLPVRFGVQPLLVLQPGQSSIEFTLGPFAAGFATESQWWGPGIRNAIIMSNHAAGIPVVHARTARPLDIRVGHLEARWVTGVLTESLWFTKQERGLRRSLSGLVLTLRTAVDTGLTVGVARVVLTEIGSTKHLVFRVLHPITVWGAGGDVRSDLSDHTDQLASAFARWVFPQGGVEVYGEWARVILPNSLRSLILAPHESQGFTVGMQWVSSDTISNTWRFQAEATNLEQGYESRTVSPPTFYVSPSVKAGYTQRGRTIGAMIGPGSSSQFLALDRMLPTRSIGLSLQRIRWDNDAYFRVPTGTGVWAHDVSLVAGLRGTQRTRWAEYSAALDMEHRLNFLFQSATSGYEKDRTFDVRNLSLRLSVRPGKVSP
jgi:hypothetical protein